MGFPIDYTILYTLLLADDKVVITGDKEDEIYLLGKLKEDYEN